MKNKLLSSHFSFLTLIFFLLTSYFSLATKVSANIVISEVYPNPESNQNEWIELYNESTTSADLTDYILKDHLSSPSTIFQFSNEMIQPQSYIVAELQSAKLNNSADGITLIDESGETIDKMSYESSEAGLSWTKNLTTNEWKLCQPTKNSKTLQLCFPASPAGGSEASPTPSPSPQSSPSPTPTPLLSSDFSFLTLSEVYPCPNTGETEWIEIRNTSSQVVKLESSKVVDASGNKKSLDLYIFGSLSYGSFEWASGFLNNSGDTVTLINQSEQEIFSIDYDECPAKGMSYIYHNGSWEWTTTPTKNEENVLTTDSEDEEDSDEDTDTSDEITNTDNNIKASELQSYKDSEVLSSHSSELTTQSFHLPNSYIQGIVLGVTSDEKQATNSAQAINLSNPNQPSMRVFLQLLFGGTTVTGASGWKLWEWWKGKRNGHSDRSGGIPFDKP